MSITQYSLSHPKVVCFFLAIMLLGGIVAFDKLAKKEDAPFVVKSAVLMCYYPGATPQEVEKLITEPIEKEIQTMQNIKKIKSESSFGMSKITVELTDATKAAETPQKWDELRRKVLNVTPNLPQGASAVVVNDDFGDVFGIYYGLSADEGFSYAELRKWAKYITTRLATVPGVVKVSAYGEPTECVNVFIPIPKLANMGITPQQLASALAAQNQVINTGERLAGEMQLKIVASGTYSDLDDIRNQTITAANGQQFRLGDIATVEQGYVNPPSTLMRINGKPAIGIGVSSDTKKDVVTIGDAVAKELAEITPLLPVGLNIEPLYLEGNIAREANNGFILNLIESVAIVVVIIMLVMGMRAGVLIGSSLIFSIGGTMLIMMYVDTGLNRTSLAGFIIAMGMLVDNAIVVTDNAQIAIKRGVPKLKALIDGATVPQWGLLGATFIAICSFLPMYLAPSGVAEMVKPLFVVLSLSLTLSWVLALSQTTTFGKWILKDNDGKEEKDPYDNRFYHRFEGMLRALIRHRWVTIGVAVAALFLSLVVMGMLPQSFFPSMDKNYFRADMFWPEGYNIREVERDMKQIEAEVMKQPEVERVSITMGSSPLRYYLASTSLGPKPNVANILIELKDKKHTVEKEEWFNNYMQQNYPNVLTRSTLFKLSPATDATIEIGFSGPNADTLVELTNQAIALMHEQGNLRHIRNSWGNKVPITTPVYSQSKGQRVGVTRQNMASSIEVATKGYTLSQYREGDRVMNILLKDNNINAFDLSNIKTLPVFNTKGVAIPLEQVVDSIPFGYDFGVIKRENREQLMMAQADPKRGVNATAAFNRIWQTVQDSISVPTGYQMTYYGEQESQKESNSALAENMPLTAFLMFLTLLLLFNNFREPIVILLMVPLIFIGIVLGLVLFGKMFDFFALLGLLGLIGMNIKNAIVLVDQINIEKEAGLPPIDAVVAATKSRIVPVAMASGTTILGMLPLLFDSLFGGLAAVIMGGLLAASLLTVLMLPVAYCAIYRIKYTEK
jgi:multidrug efflux pump subunit AcrB